MDRTDKTGIYIHIPYCAGKCPYCDFYSCVSTRCPDEYVDALCDEMLTRRRMREFTGDGNITADTLYFGGGTPSLLSPVQLKRLIDTAKKAFCIESGAEITIECNPTSKGLEKLLYTAAENGVNRVSLGMQSSTDGERRLLGRRGRADDVKNAVSAAQRAGIDNISLDIMVGVPESNMSTLKASLDFAVDLGAKHISAYILKIEENTYFGRHFDTLNLPSEDCVCDMYLFMSEYLTKNGFSHYEISNFGKDGFFSRHNMKYWTDVPYLGFGAAAHSYYNNKRFFFPRDTKKFISAAGAVSDGFGGDMKEKILLGLRTSQGITLSDKGGLFIKKAEQLVHYGFAKTQRDVFSLTPKGWLLSNTVISELLNVYEKEN